jgi:hypothetical protein
MLVLKCNCKMEKRSAGANLDGSKVQSDLYIHCNSPCTVALLRPEAGRELRHANQLSVSAIINIRQRELRHGLLVESGDFYRDGQRDACYWMSMGCGCYLTYAGCRWLRG